jgi:hypothetical protein
VQLHEEASELAVTGELGHRGDEAAGDEPAVESTEPVQRRRRRHDRTAIVEEG